MAAQSRSTLYALIAAQLANNTSGNITASAMRNVVNSVVESSENRVDDVAVAKTTPVDGDGVRIVDSAASGAPKVVLWSNIKATIFAAWGTLVNAATGKTTPVDADSIAISDSAASNATKKLTFANLKTWIISQLGALIATVSGKTTPVDADLFLLSDSAASNVAKFITWANIKATIFAAFGGLINSATGKTTPVNTDLLLLSDSEDSSSSKKLSLSDLKTFLAASDTAAGLIEYADQSEMEAATSNTRAVTPGRMHFHPGVAKAIARWDASSGTPTLGFAYNITSLTDSGTGITDVVIATDLSSSANCVPFAWSGLAGVRSSTDCSGSGNIAAGQVRVVSAQPHTASLHDPSTVSFFVFGDM